MYLEIKNFKVLNNPWVKNKTRKEGNYKVFWNNENMNQKYETSKLLSATYMACLKIKFKRWGGSMLIRAGAYSGLKSGK